MFPGIVLCVWWSRNHLHPGKNIACYKQNNNCHPPSSLLRAMLHFGLHLKKPKPVCRFSSFPKPFRCAICNSCKFDAGCRVRKITLWMWVWGIFSLTEHVDDLLILMRYAAVRGKPLASWKPALQECESGTCCSTFCWSGKWKAVKTRESEYFLNDLLGSLHCDFTAQFRARSKSICEVLCAGRGWVTANVPPTFHMHLGTRLQERAERWARGKKWWFKSSAGQKQGKVTTDY